MRVAPIGWKNFGVLRSRLTAYADIILPLAVPGRFTYALPEALAPRVQAGVRVVVPFGRGRKLYSGLVARVHAERPVGREARDILDVLDEGPIVNEHQLRFWERMAEHYLCTLGEVMLAAVPGALVLNSATRIVAAPRSEAAWTGDPRRDLLLDALERREELTLAEAGELLGLRDPMPVIKRLLDAGQLMLAEEIQEAYKPRLDRFVRLVAGQGTEEALHGWFDRLEKAPKQLHLLMRYVELSRCLGDDPREVKRDHLLRAAQASSAELQRLCAKGVFEVYERLAGAPSGDAPARRQVVLSAAQQKVLSEVVEGFADRSVVLLQGVTASGKTEVYMELIAAAMARGEQVLYLLPEIALTTQVIGRLRDRFGPSVAVFHSRLPQRERTELWLRMLRDPAAHPIVVGARSALFLPFVRLGLVLVDEEHDTSYKQHDPAPRYHARDMAVVLAGLHGGKVLLGSATPSMESLFNARSGKYGLALLSERFGDAVLPLIQRVDLTEERKRKRMQGEFSSTLLEAVGQAIARKEQAILFQNRRGYVPAWQCETCGWVPECEHCDVSLTYHKQAHGLRCHYCGREYAPPVQCASCGSNRLRMLGFGTEKVEEQLALLLPEARIARLDQDTTRGKHAFERILTRFGEGEVDVLVGTQMVTKGLDFDQVTVVGILNADHLMRFPDLRAHERAFQIMAQVAGRSGRKREPGRVLIQGRDIHHPVIGLVVAHDVDGMYARELPLRQAHGYPPYSRLVRLTLKHRYEDRVEATARLLAAALRERLGERVLGPEPPLVARVRDKHLRDILLKLDRNAYRAEKEFVSGVLDRVFADAAHSPVQVVVDVDPT